MGRTGAWFAHAREAIRPDIVTLAKALGNGFPMGAVLATGGAADLFTPGSHGTTFGGNPLAARVGLTVLEQVEPLLDQVTSTGAWLMEQLRALPGVAGVRGRGLFIGILTEEPLAAQIVAAARNHGIIMNAPRESVVRLVPPLILTPDQVSPLLEVWPALLDEARHG
jgi:acetylornithine aminotransferase